MKQKTIFLDSEGNEWYRRNVQALRSRELPEADPVLMEIIKIALPRGEASRILEVGCGDGSRLAWLNRSFGYSVSGVDPSGEAVEAARKSGVDAHRGTADALPFSDGTFDIAVFGFCLYLCDRDDLFRIASEADRVLKSPGWLVILDFYSQTPTKREYHHRSGLYSYKMDYRTLFTWHPGYTELTHTVRHHADGGYTDDPQEWVATSVLRKWIDSAR